MASFAVFDESFYLANNPDVAAAVAAGTFSSGLDHYIQFGEAEGRSGIPFGEESYLAVYPLAIAFCEYPYYHYPLVFLYPKNRTISSLILCSL